MKDSYYFQTYSDHIPPNVALLNYVLTILFYKLSYNSRLLYKFRNFLLLHRTNHRVHFYPFPRKKEVTAETVTSNLFHPTTTLIPIFIQPTANHSSSHRFSHASVSYHFQSHLLKSDMIHILSPIWQLPLPLSEY